MRIAVDTGGTFTDLVVETDTGELLIYKSPTTPGKPLEGVGAALQLAAQGMGLTRGELLERAAMFIYGTTHALNAVVTGRTAKTALLVTQGHPDILVLREGGRPDAFDYSISTPDPYIPRSLTFEVPERILADGTVAHRLDEPELRQIAASLSAAGAEAVAVCFLWANINAAHEQRTREILHEMLPGIPVSISSDVSPSIREYRRASATAIDASLRPAVEAHLIGLRDFLRNEGLNGELFVITSIGGLVQLDAAAAMPIQMLNSGPAMAPVSGRFFAQQDAQKEYAIVADTGGTTYDVSVIRRGSIPMSRQTMVQSPTGLHMTGFPSIDIKSMGAGGGSIAWVDGGGMLHVGPQSAGADPGPAAYGRGATDATLTDACLVLGYLDPDFFLGGLRRLDLQAAIDAVKANVAIPLNLSVEQAASAVVRIATENMALAIEEITINQGIDPATAVLVGGGGAAGLNCAWIARRIGVEQLVIPRLGPALSAGGALMSDLTAQFRKTCFLRTDAFDAAAANRTIEHLVAQADDFFNTAKVEGVTELLIEARYPDQVWEIDVLLPITRFTSDGDVQMLAERFHAAHEEIFGISDLESPVEIVNWCISASGRIRQDGALAAPVLEADGQNQRAASRRQAYFDDAGYVDTYIYRFDSLLPGKSVQGPAIIESPFTTVVIPPDGQAVRTEAGSLLLTME